MRNIWGDVKYPIFKHVQIGQFIRSLKIFARRRGDGSVLLSLKRVDRIHSGDGCAIRIFYGCRFRRLLVLGEINKWCQRCLPGLLCYLGHSCGRLATGGPDRWKTLLSCDFLGNL